MINLLQTAPSKGVYSWGKIRILAVPAADRAAKLRYERSPARLFRRISRRVYRWGAPWFTAPAAEVKRPQAYGLFKYTRSPARLFKRISRRAYRWDKPRIFSVPLATHGFSILYSRTPIRARRLFRNNRGVNRWGVMWLRTMSKEYYFSFTYLIA